MATRRSSKQSSESLTPAQIQKDKYDQNIMQWLDKNYMSVPGIFVSGYLVYQHYTHYCATQSLTVKTQRLFQQIVKKKYPQLNIKKTARGKNCWYYQGLDIRKTSDEYESVVKGRKLLLNKCTKIDTELTSLSDSAKEKVSEESNLTVKDWAVMSAHNKESHRKVVFDWLEKDYEISPNICLSRTTVYNHYVDHCRQQGAPPAISAMLGKWMLKKFPTTVMRRLGTRGNSRYYYMGIDVREESDHYTAVSSERVVCSSGKTKLSSFHYKTRQKSPKSHSRSHAKHKQ